MTEVQGYYDSHFGRVADLLRANLDSGADIGASVAVVLDGQMVVDLWGGWADLAKTSLWQADTITNVWSSTKTVTSLAALTLVTQEKLDLNQPVADYWPEFAANGKEAVLVRHLLSHTSGVSGWQQPVDNNLAIELR